MRIFVTGGAGFIGSNFLNLFVPGYPQHEFVNLDKLTYAANPRSLDPLASCDNYSFEQLDIADAAALEALFARKPPDLVVHFAAESHVDRSIVGPADFIHSNICGTFQLLECCRRHFRQGHGLFHHVSTDEVYGSLDATERCSETLPYDPSSPYSASKAASDHLVRAYHRTYGLPIRVTNCSNNYGPRQFPEKLIPLMILNALERKPLPVYGDGQNVRDWLYVEDHCHAIWRVIERGAVGQTYNVGGNSAMTNLELVRRLCEVVAEETACPAEQLTQLITFVPDRPGHDRRYAIDASKIARECGFQPKEDVESGLRKTVRWYLDNEAWVTGVRSGAYRAWLKQNYEDRR